MRILIPNLVLVARRIERTKRLRLERPSEGNAARAEGRAKQQSLLRQIRGQAPAARGRLARIVRVHVLGRPLPSVFGIAEMRDLEDGADRWIHARGGPIDGDEHFF
jgi:hypothetical protein